MRFFLPWRIERLFGWLVFWAILAVAAGCAISLLLLPDKVVADKVIGPLLDRVPAMIQDRPPALQPPTPAQRALVEGMCLHRRLPGLSSVRHDEELRVTFAREPGVPLELAVQNPNMPPEPVTGDSFVLRLGENWEFRLRYADGFELHLQPTSVSYVGQRKPVTYSVLWATPPRRGGTFSLTVIDYTDPAPYWDQALLPALVPAGSGAVR